MTAPCPGGSRWGWCRRAFQAHMTMNLSTSWCPVVLWNTVWEPLIEFKAKGNALSSSWKPGVPLNAPGLWTAGIQMPTDCPSPWAPSLAWDEACQHQSCSELATRFLRQPCPDWVHRPHESCGPSSSLSRWGFLLERLGLRARSGWGTLSPLQV